MSLTTIENANANIYRLSVILRLCAKGLEYVNDSEAKSVDYNHSTIGDALTVISDMIEHEHDIIVTATENIK